MDRIKTQNSKLKTQNLRLKKLEYILKKLKSVVIAYSGGVDSTFLAKTATIVLGRKNVLAVTAKSETYPSSENRQARAVAKSLDVPQKIIHTKELNIKNFANNPTNRCFYCKKELFTRLNKISRTRGLETVIDGSNYDDLSDWRAGSLAAKKLGVRSPLTEAGITKSDIRGFSKKLGLPTWDKPSFACLASRIPYNSKITKDRLRKVDKAESFLRGLGFRQVRVRYFGNTARIEVEGKSLKKLMKLRSEIVKKLKKIGFIYITADLSGYRTGSMNEEINQLKT